MLASRCVNLCKDLVKSVSRGYGERCLENPAIEFSKDVKAGMYNDVSDREYEDILNEVKEISRFWFSRRSSSVIDLFKTVLENSDITEEQALQIGKIIANAYLNTKQDSIPCASPNKELFQDNLFQKDVCNFKSEVAGTEEKMFESDNSTNVENESIFQSPRTIYEYLAKNVYGQESAKRAASLLLWNHINGRRQNVVFAGPTGCGKTEIFRQLLKIYPNIAIYDATTLTSEGWTGNMKIQNLFTNLHPMRVEHSIIVLDEADKMFEPKIGSSNTDYSYLLQNEFLKILEGDSISLQGKDGTVRHIKTANISFVFLGSFETMVNSKNRDRKNSLGFLADVSAKTEEFGYECEFSSSDLVKYAHVRQEIAGRVNSIVQLQSMEEEDYYNILCDKWISPIKQVSQYYGVKIRMPEKAKKALAKEAVQNKMGVRFMKSKIQTLLNEQLFEDCKKKVYTLQ